MKKTSTVVSIIVLTLVGMGLFNVAQNVRDYEAQLKTLNRQIAHERDTIHILKAEWFYLNQPDRLEKLAHKHTNLEPITEKNFVAFAAIPNLDQEDEMLADNNADLDVQEVVKVVNKATGYDSYISKASQKSHAPSAMQEALPIQNVSLRDIWRP